MSVHGSSSDQLTTRLGVTAISLQTNMANKISEFKRGFSLCVFLTICALTLYMYVSALDHSLSNLPTSGYFIISKAENSRLGMQYTRIAETSKPRNFTRVKLLYSYAEMSKMTGNRALPVSFSRGYILENPDLCKSYKDLLLLIVVYSAPTYFEKRSVLRRTWLNPKHLAAFGSTKVVFVVGKTDPFTQDKIQQELEVHGDILQGDFIDTYRNLTEKGITMYKWILERCKNAKLILKTDDDVVINIFNLFRFLVPSLYGKSKSVICNYKINSEIQRKRKEKWFIERNLFRNQSVYPPYCSGFFVLFTNDLTPILFKTVKSTPYFWIEDVYLYGLLYHRIQGIEIRSIKRSTFSIGKKKALRCFNDTGWHPENCMYVLVTADLNVASMETYWNELVRSVANEADRDIFSS